MVDVKKDEVEAQADDIWIDNIKLNKQDELRCSFNPALLMIDVQKDACSETPIASNWKMCYPFRPCTKSNDSTEFPFRSLGFLNMMTYHWMSNRIYKIKRQGHLDAETVWFVPFEEQATCNCKKLEELWNEEASKKARGKPILRSVLIKHSFLLFMTGLLLNFLCNVLTFLSPAVLFHLLLKYVQGSRDDMAYGLLLVFLVFLTEMCGSFLQAGSMFLSILCAGRVKAGFLYFMYKKINNLRGLQGRSVGEFINLFANDSQRLFDLFVLMPTFLMGPVLVISAIIYCTLYLGPWGSVGCVFLAFYYVFQVGMISEVLKSIKTIKLYTWEKSFADRISKCRANEESYLKIAAFLQSLSTAVILLVILFSLVTTFAGYIGNGNLLYPSQAFVIMSVHYLTRTKLTILPYILRILSDAKLALKRAESILNMEELDKNAVSSKTQDLSNAVEISNATFAWTRIENISSVIFKNSNNFNSKADDPSGNIRNKNHVVDEEDASKVDKNEQENIKSSYLNNKKEEKSLHDKNGKFQQNSNFIKSSTSLDNETNLYVPAKPKLFPNSYDLSLLKKQNLSASQIILDVKKENILNDSIATNSDDLFASVNTTRSSEKINGMKKAESFHKRYLPVLREINLTIKKGKIIAVCGRIGSGKSSLMSAILGQTKLLKGSVAIQGSTGYVPHNVWLVNDTIKENILFGKPFDEPWYKEIVLRCSLVIDFKTFKRGDETMLGESGINLSGGQRLRLGLARAIYADPDVLLLDDPFSAVDRPICQQLFENCLKPTAARGKTVIFNTQELEFVERCDEIIFLKDGQIIERGIHENLMQSKTEYAKLVKLFNQKPHLLLSSVSSHDGIFVSEERESRESVLSSAWKFFEENVASADESISDGEEYVPNKPVEWSTYASYVQAAGGIKTCFFVLLFFLLTALCFLFNSYWLSYYLSGCVYERENNGNSTHSYHESSTGCPGMSLHLFLYIYVFSALLVVIMLFLRGLLFVKVSLRAASRIHEQFFKKILRCPMSFFEDVPAGKILSTMSSGMDGIDVRLPLQTEELLQNVGSILMCILSISIVFPYFLIIVVFLSTIFCYLQSNSRLVTRQFKKGESMTKAPIYNHVRATVQGLETIHAFKRDEDYNKKFEILVNQHMSYTFMLLSYIKWLGLRLEFLSIFATSIVAFFIVITKGSVPASLAGHAIAYASQLNGLFQYTTRMMAETEARFTSVQRIQNFLQSTVEEAPEIIEDHRPAKTWPSKGDISFVDYSLKYRASLPLVLRDVTFNVHPSEKIGIVGRSGCGKTSLTSALFRLVEKNHGTIEIDGIDISSIGLYDLRSRLSIVPQDPVLFVGTIRYNLDPFSLYTDEQLWTALEKCHMKKQVMLLKKKLESEVIEDGANFSVGERQLLCLVRAVLKASKILILDEATGAVDIKTDKNIQITIGQAFSECTILTIAHRVRNVLDFDRIMVIDDGKIVEFDAPRKLLSNRNSKFNKLLA